MTARREYVKVVSFETSLSFKRWCGEDMVISVLKIWSLLKQSNHGFWKKRKVLR